MPDDWIALSDRPLPDAAAWAVVPDCGAVVTFTGTVRDHAEGRMGVTALDYEAYEGPAVARMTDIAAEARRRWPELGRVAVLHRTGKLRIGEAAVVVAVSAPHRGEAFSAAEWIIDTVKASVPIWKKRSGPAVPTGAPTQPPFGPPDVANLLYLLGAVIFTAIICGVLYVRNRKPSSMESGIDSFQRELRALSPERRAGQRDGRRSG